VGAVPLEWYKDEDHIGYDKDGRRIMKKARGDQLDALLRRNDSKKVCVCCVCVALGGRQQSSAGCCSRAHLRPCVGGEGPVL
jgi:hypothetical protein